MKLSDKEQSNRGSSGAKDKKQGSPMMYDCPCGCGAIIVEDDEYGRKGLDLSLFAPLTKPGSLRMVDFNTFEVMVEEPKPHRFRGTLRNVTVEDLETPNTGSSHTTTSE